YTRVLLRSKAPYTPPIIGPTTGIQAYPQSDVPFPGIGNKACMIRGPKSRAGLIAYPVAPPKDTPIATINKPTINGERPSAKSFAPTINSKANNKANVPITALNKFCNGLRTLSEEPGAVANTPSFAALSFVSLQCGK